MNFSQNPNPNPNFPFFPDHHHHNMTMVESEFELSDYLILDDYHHHDHHHLDDQDNQDSYSSQSMVSSEFTSHGSSSGATSRNSHMQMKNKKINEVGNRVAFRTKSELEVMDDGFKWRKYGKKSVKNSPNPR
ncbi:hypothetical protein Pint_26960 [Pistacia integerrima]|uniref:Uncharacterized protein n=1 Tax=Pistacia integerrima TaxID=434235 RepID=A0ACC0YQT1_9ROSI|nr:hypothetical protein Pint_26960 [Pistacia integerrima]